MALPTRLDWPQAQSQWSAQLNPLLADPLNQTVILSGITLVAGVNVINHKLGRKMQGYLIAGQNAASNVYFTAPFNDLTLTLTASAPVIVNLVIF
jgi:hypothetical protein